MKFKSPAQLNLDTNEIALLITMTSEQSPEENIETTQHTILKSHCLKQKYKIDN